jgi:hypothetical protein
MKKTIFLIASLMAALMLVTPAFAFWHPPDTTPPCSYFGVEINGNSTTASHRYIFAEPDDGYCDNFEVKVYIANVTDLYGYDFKLTYNKNYFSLVSYTVAAVWPAQVVIMPPPPTALPDASGSYEQVVVATAPSAGVTGTFLLATLVFHIDNDVCYCYPSVTGVFKITTQKASNSCSEEIELCDPFNGYWRFDPVEPSLWIIPKSEVNSIVGDKFTISVLLKDIVKMTDFDLFIYWDGYFHTPGDPCGFWAANPWTTLLTTTKADVVINQAVFPAANSTKQDITVLSPKCGIYTSNPQGHVEVNVVMDPSYPLINLTNPSTTIWLFNVTFTKCDPWYCGAQPYYTDLGNHDWRLENASTPINFWAFDLLGISTTCGTYLIGSQCIKVTNANFTFAPIPGDLDGSGHTDIADLMIEASYYGLPGWGIAGSCTAPAGNPPNAIPQFYDLNHDGIIDIYDIVIVAKNFCRTTP